MTEAGRLLGELEATLLRLTVLLPDDRKVWEDSELVRVPGGLEHSANCVLVSQDDLRSSPQETMTNLCNALDLAPAPVRFAAYFRSTPDASRTDVYDQKLYAEAAALYRELEALTLTSKVLEGVDR